MATANGDRAYAPPPPPLGPPSKAAWAKHREEIEICETRISVPGGGELHQVGWPWGHCGTELMEGGSGWYWTECDDVFVDSHRSHRDEHWYCLEREGFEQVWVRCVPLAARYGVAPGAPVPVAQIGKPL